MTRRLQLDPDVLAGSLEHAATRADTAGWLRASEGAFAFWDNSQDDVWDRVSVEPAD